MSQFLPPLQKRKQQRNTKGYIFLKTKQVIRTWELKGCFLRCCRWGEQPSLFFFLLFLTLSLWFGTDGPAMIDWVLCYQQSETVHNNSSDQGHDCQSSHLIDHCHTEHTQTKVISWELYSQKETKIDTKIDLIYSARTALLVLAAKTGQRDRQASRTDRHLSADA